MKTSFSGRTGKPTAPLHSLCVRGWGHRTTDPACRLHRVPRTRWQRRRFELARGYGCVKCVPPRSAAEQVRSAAQ